MYFGWSPPSWLWYMFHPCYALEEVFDITVRSPIDRLAYRVGLSRMLHLSLVLNVLLAAGLCAAWWF